MNPWFWAPIGLGILGFARLFYILYWDEEISWFAWTLLLAALVWTVCLTAMDSPPNPAPATTRLCTAKALEPVYDPALKETVPTWVCVGWSEQ